MGICILLLQSVHESDGLANATMCNDQLTQYSFAYSSCVLVQVIVKFSIHTQTVHDTVHMACSTSVAAHRFRFVLLLLPKRHGAQAWSNYLQQ